MCDTSNASCIMGNSFYPFVDFRIVQTYTALQRAFQWRVDSAFRDIGPFTFTVEASETPDFSTLLYSIAAGSGFYALDEEKLRQGEVADFYYRVKLATGSAHTFYSPTLVHTSHKEKRRLYLIAKEIIRKEFVNGQI